MMSMESIEKLWREYRNKNVLVCNDFGGTIFKGVVIGIDEDGWLLIESTDGWCGGHFGKTIFENLVYGNNEKPDTPCRWFSRESGVKKIEDDFIQI